MTKKLTKTPVQQYNKAKAIACPQCKADVGKVCVKINGVGCRTHRTRVLKWERDRK